MASATRDHDESEGVLFVHEEDGSITARHIETGVASFGDTKSEVLRMLAEALELHEGAATPSRTSSTKSATNSPQRQSQTTNTGSNNSSTGPTKPASTT